MAATRGQRIDACLAGDDLVHADPRTDPGAAVSGTTFRDRHRYSGYSPRLPNSGA